MPQDEDQIEATRWLDNCVTDIHNKLGLEWLYILHHLNILADKVVLQIILEEHTEEGGK
jgi:hypothetical protein